MLKTNSVVDTAVKRYVFVGVETMTDEQVEIHDVSSLYVGRKDLMKNLPALVNLALNHIENGHKSDVLRTW